MIVEEVDPQLEAETAEIPTIPRPEEEQGPSGLRPKCMFPPELNPIDRSKWPAEIKKVRKRKTKPDTHTRVYTDKGKPVLYSDIWLHLQKIQQKAQREEVLEDPDCSDEELV